MEYELCKIYGCSPKELGKMRRQDPQGIEFMELYTYSIWQERKKQMKKHHK